MPRITNTKNPSVMTAPSRGSDNGDTTKSTDNAFTLTVGLESFRKRLGDMHNFFQQNHSNIKLLCFKAVLTIGLTFAAYYTIKAIGSAIYTRSPGSTDKKEQHKKLTSRVLAIMVQIVLYSVYILFIVYIWGFHVLSVVAMLGTLLLALSLGLQGIVTNFAAGILIAAQQQYRIGDVIETTVESGSPAFGGGVAGNLTGVVTRFDLFHTELKDINTHVLHKIRNADLYAGIITNYSQVDRLVFSFDIHCSTHNDMGKMLKIVNDTVKAHPICIQDATLPSPSCWIRSDDGKHGGGVRVGVKFYMRPEDFIGARGFEVQTAVFQALQRHNIRFIETNSLLQLPSGTHNFVPRAMSGAQQGTKSFATFSNNVSNGVTTRSG